MPLHITKPGQRVPVGTINILIYGQPSTGKTSLSYTMRNPLVIDFDGGAHRSQQSILGTTVRVDSWADIEELFNSDAMAQFDTIVIDTVGSALDYLANFIIKTNPKMGTTKGTLTMAGWGELKAVFSAWFRRVNVMGKNVVMIAHHKEEKEGDATRKRPDIQGSSYGLVLKQADFVGFAYLNEASKRVIGFAPTADYFGKDSARLGVIEVEDFDNNPEYGGELIERMRAAFQDVQKEDKQVKDTVRAWFDVIDNADTPELLTNHMPNVLALPNPAGTQVKDMVKKHAAKMGWRWDAKTKQWGAA